MNTVKSGKADIGKRFMAGLIDAVLAAGVSAILHVVGGLLGAAYILVRDGLDLDFMDRRSIGKKLLKLRPVRLDGAPMDMLTSVKRNITLCIGSIGMIFIWIPVTGWFTAGFFGFVGLLAGLLEIFLVLTDAEGRRLGDKIAETKVIESND